jgi:hypothetical protein
MPWPAHDRLVISELTRNLRLYLAAHSPAFWVGAFPAASSDPARDRDIILNKPEIPQAAAAGVGPPSDHREQQRISPRRSV